MAACHASGLAAGALRDVVAWLVREGPNPFSCAAIGELVSVAVTWLDDAQLEIMHHSEIAAANYAFAELDGVRVQLDDGANPERALAYVSSRGSLSLDGAPVALAAIRCEARRYRAMDTSQVLEQVRLRLAPALDADAFVHRLLDDRTWRHEVTEALSRDAHAFSHPFRILR